MEQVRCPHCGKLLLVTAEFRAQDCACPACAVVFKPAQVLNKPFSPPPLAAGETAEEVEDFLHRSTASNDEIDVDYLALPLDLERRPGPPNAEIGGPAAPALDLQRPVVKITFVVGCVLGLVIGATAHDGRDLSGIVCSVPVFGVFAILMVLALVRLYQQVSGLLRWFTSLALAAALAMTVTVVLAIFRDGRRVNLGDVMVFVAFALASTLVLLYFIVGAIEMFRTRPSK